MNDWNEDTTNLLKKWQRTCALRKREHIKMSKSFGKKNKAFMVPIILISTILGSLSFIDPSTLNNQDCNNGNRRLGHGGDGDGDGGGYGDGDGDEYNHHEIIISGGGGGGFSLPTTAPTIAPDESSSSPITIPYIIGGLNMTVALLSAIQSFLNYNSAQDRHERYARLFASLEVDLDTLFAKPPSQRGNTSALVDKYKARYTMLLNNAPTLSTKIIQKIDDAEASIELT